MNRYKWHSLRFSDHSRIEESAFCSMSPKIVNEIPVFEVSFCIFFVIPMILIILLYGRMGAKIRSRTNQKLGKYLAFIDPKRSDFRDVFQVFNKAPTTGKRETPK